MFTSRPENFAIRVVALVKQIPPGRVATYGQLAALAGAPRHARYVGRILQQSHDPDLPWHRVINQKGRISLPDYAGHDLQRQLLLQEGVVFDKSGKIDLNRFGWVPEK